MFMSYFCISCNFINLCLLEAVSTPKFLMLLALFHTQTASCTTKGLTNIVPAQIVYIVTFRLSFNSSSPAVSISVYPKMFLLVLSWTNATNASRSKVYELKSLEDCSPLMSLPGLVLPGCSAVPCRIPPPHPTPNPPGPEAAPPRFSRAPTGGARAAEALRVPVGTAPRAEGAGGGAGGGAASSASSRAPA